MNIQSDKEYMIFRKVYADRVYHRIGLSRKKTDNSYENGYIQVRFPNGVDIADRSKIKLQEAWVTFYKGKEIVNGAEYTKTIPYIFINKFSYGNSQTKVTSNSHQINETPKQEIVADPFAEFGQENQIELSEMDLPFNE